MQATEDTRELEALHAETLHMRSLCLDLEAKISSDAQVLSSLQREKQLLVMQNSQLLAMQPGGSSNLRNSSSSFESKGGELAQRKHLLPCFCNCLFVSPSARLSGLVLIPLPHLTFARSHLRSTAIIFSRHGSSCHEPRGAPFLAPFLRARSGIKLFIRQLCPVACFTHIFRHRCP